MTGSTNSTSTRDAGAAQEAMLRSEPSAKCRAVQRFEAQPRGVTNLRGPAFGPQSVRRKRRAQSSFDLGPRSRLAGRHPEAVGGQANKRWQLADESRILEARVQHGINACMERVTLGKRHRRGRVVAVKHGKVAAVNENP